MSLFYHASGSLRASSQQTHTTASQTPLQPTISAAFSVITTYEKKLSWYKDITSPITHGTANDMVPISTVEKQGFQKLMTVMGAKNVWGFFSV